jgi:hypothetical protein
MLEMTHNASLGPCCDDPDVVTKYYPVIACRNCGLIWEEGIPEPKPAEQVITTKLPLTA